ncbi:SMP-30/gluconolactonase/LRE family protein [Streptomyces sp. NPDC005876]|uniref:SMP-30/gluconolactonase/LRE family protein n=1 Tax=Streptomyces sp. NPDC005876 TaxID=3157076 RepID=UPI0033F41789
MTRRPHERPAGAPDRGLGRRRLLGAGMAVAAGSVSLAPPAAAAPRGGGSGPALPVPRVTEIARMGPIGCEGIVFDHSGRLFMSDTLGTEILSIRPDGSAEPWSRGLTGAPNGHKVLPDGTHLVAQMGPPAAVLWLDADGNVLRTLTEDDRGRPLRAPNDVTVDPRTGACYVSDPGRFATAEPGRVYRLDHPGGRLRTVVDEGVLRFPNGLALTPDRRFLMVSEGGRNRVMRFPVRRDGTLGERRFFASLPSQPNTWTEGEAQPDGLAFDADGRLYVAHFGTGLIRVHDARGRDLGSLDSRCPCVTNLVFGGPDLDQLYVTGHLGTSLSDPGPAVVVRLTLPGVRGLSLLGPDGSGPAT